jgi:hypothetical protein
MHQSNKHEKLVIGRKKMKQFTSGSPLFSAFSNGKSSSTVTVDFEVQTSS